jgi:hypothetical protein
MDRLSVDDRTAKKCISSIVVDSIGIMISKFDAVPNIIHNEGSLSIIINERTDGRAYNTVSWLELKILCSERVAGNCRAMRCIRLRAAIRTAVSDAPAG